MLSLGAVLAFCATTAKSQELVVNGDFLTDASGWQLIDHPYTANWQSDPGPDGVPGTFQINDYGWVHPVETNQLVSGLAANSGYVVSGWYKRAHYNSSDIQFRVMMDNTAYFGAGGQFSSDWHPFAFNYVANDGDAMLRLQAQVTTDDDYWIDKISMTPATPVAVSFRAGADTMLDEAAPDTPYGGWTTVFIDGRGGGSLRNDGLLAFSDIIGSGAGQIPLGATILQAKLTLNIPAGYEGQCGATVHRMLQSWQESDTWNMWVDGIDADDIEAASAIDASVGVVGAGVLVIEQDLKNSLQGWADGAPNCGWAFLAGPDSPDGWSFSSREEGIGSLRPLLEVTFLPPIPEPGAVATAVIVASVLLVRRRAA